MKELMNLLLLSDVIRNEAENVHTKLDKNKKDKNDRIK
jgi:hypothetical protein